MPDVLPMVTAPRDGTEVTLMIGGAELGPAKFIGTEPFLGLPGYPEPVWLVRSATGYVTYLDRAAQGWKPVSDKGDSHA